LELLKSLLNLTCVSGFEKEGNAELKNLLKNICGNCVEDAMGNLFGFIRSEKDNAPTVMLTAHYDIIGLMVRDISENGFIGFEPIGGVDSRLLPGEEVIIHGNGKDFYGIIGLRPPHILTAEEFEKPEKTENLVIDTGTKKEELEKYVSIGQAISFKNTVRFFGGGISARGLDNRAGCYAILKAAEKLKDKKLKNNICIMLSACEEQRRSGGKTGAYKARPDIAVVVDATFAKTPECEGKTENEAGSGPVICKGPSLNRFYTEKLTETAQKAEIPYQIEVEGGDNGTDAFVIETVRSGIPCVLVSFPLKYMHSCIETVNLHDLDKLAELIGAFAEGFEMRDL